MRTVQIVDGVYPELAGRFSESPVTLPTDIDYALGAISKEDGSPALRYMLDPDPAFIRAGAGEIGPDALRDSASGSKWSTNVGKSIVQATAINGQPTITLDAATALLRPSGQATFNHDAFSLFCVINSPVASTVRHIIGPNETTDITPLAGSCAVLLSTGGFLNVYLGSTGAQLVENTQAWQGQAVLIGVCFSTERGVTIRRNGVQVAADAARVTPLTGTALNLFSGGGTGSRFSGNAGKLLLADVDLSLPAHAKDLATIEDHLKSLYGIA